MKKFELTRGRDFTAKEELKTGRWRVGVREDGLVIDLDGTSVVLDWENAHDFTNLCFEVLNMHNDQERKRKEAEGPTDEQLLD